MGATAGGSASAGLTFGPHLRLIGEVGSFQVDRLDNAVGTTPPSALLDGSKAAAYHVNANIEYRFADRNRLAPYVTAGIGSFASPTVGESDLGPFDSHARTRVTHAASNVGAGVTYRLTNWLGVGADYRYFVLNTDKAPHVNRFTTGVTLHMK
jgi:opacity protein-like surface antigen